MRNLLSIHGWRRAQRIDLKEGNVFDNDSPKNSWIDVFDDIQIKKKH